MNTSIINATEVLPVVLPYDEFKKAVMAKLQNTLGEEVTVTEYAVNKNNRILDGLSIKPAGSNVAPTVYPEFYYKELKDSGLSIAEMIDKAVEEIISSIVSAPLSFSDVKDATEKVQDWSYVQGNVFARLVGTIGNSEFLKGKVVRRISGIDDLAVIYYVLLGEVNHSDDSVQSAVVTEGLFRLWGVSEDELFEAAIANTEATATVQSLNELLPPWMQPEPQDCMPMLVVSNLSRVNGNGGMVCPKVMARVCQKLGTDEVLIIPSSVNEFIAIPESIEMPPEAIKELICEVNTEQVCPEERVSNSAYRWSPATGLSAA